MLLLDVAVAVSLQETIFSQCIIIRFITLLLSPRIFLALKLFKREMLRLRALGMLAFWLFAAKLIKEQLEDIT